MQSRCVVIRGANRGQPGRLYKGQLKEGAKEVKTCLVGGGILFVGFRFTSMTNSLLENGSKYLVKKS